MLKLTDEGGQLLMVNGAHIIAMRNQPEGGAAIYMVSSSAGVSFWVKEPVEHIHKLMGGI